MRRILFIASQREDHPRVQIIQQALRQQFELTAVTSRLPWYWLRALAVAIRGIFALRKQNDLLFIGFLPQLVVPIIGRLSCKPIVADVFYSLYDTIISDRKLVSPSSRLARVCRRLDRSTLQRADVVVCDTQAHGEFMAREFGVSEGKFHRVWIGAGKTFSSANLPPLIFEPDQVFRVLFFGTFIPLQGVDVIIRAAAELVEQKIELLLVGEGQTLADCEKLAQELRLKNVTFLGKRTAAEIISYAQGAHVILGIFGKSGKAQRVIPHKAFEALALNRPLITGKSRASEELLSDRKNAILCQTGSPRDLAEAILWTRNNYQEAIAIANAGREIYRTVAASDAITAQLTAAIAAVTIDENRLASPTAHW